MVVSQVRVRLSNISDKDTTFFDSQWTDVMNYDKFSCISVRKCSSDSHHSGNNNILELGAGMCIITEWTTNCVFHLE
ncbi:hypothetical protein LIPSTDRAFT_72515 [Lipomyces starkeyi NRRL Y-11557]|uniref:Uncharacterized protein n=1 Tax=Lipomyces starkeyi NRRL Y-11557 TaxID=675824 RepID=A0A1E3Q4B6_LIPST|nr:hypothetical protein LIPSTDRAFT_72515 [Lipomyces starkeyi NRRL Y-11557]